jgi:hypothetical protein
MKIYCIARWFRLMPPCRWIASRGHARSRCSQLPLCWPVPVVIREGSIQYQWTFVTRCHDGRQNMKQSLLSRSAAIRSAWDGARRDIRDADSRAADGQARHYRSGSALQPLRPRRVPRPPQASAVLSQASRLDTASAGAHASGSVPPATRLVLRGLGDRGGQSNHPIVFPETASRNPEPQLFIQRHIVVRREHVGV